MNTEKIKGRFRRKHLLVVATAILFFIGVTIFLFLYHKDEHRFTKMTNTLFRDEMSQNTLNMHYTLAYPENFGIYDYNAVLPAYSAESKQKGQEQTKEVLETLSKINPNRLPDNQQYTYRLLKNALETALTMSGYPYYQEPLSPASGMQTQLPILLAEYSFRNKKDVEDYLELLNQTDEYFDSLVVYEQEKAKAGLFMNSLSLEKVLTQCETILTKESLLAGDHFLQTTFVERLEDLYKQETITREEAKYYIAQNNRLLSTVLMPAYEALYDGLFVLEDETIALEGLGSKPEGAAYYELLLRSETGSNRDIAQIKKMLTTQLETEFGALHQLLTDHQDLILSDYSYELDRAFPYQSPKQMLPDLQERMAQDFPPLVNAKPQVYVKSVTDSLEEYCAPAYYLTPPLDDSDNNVIYINERNSPQNLELYTTLAHEGFPGHLYQTVYHNYEMYGEKDNYVRQILWHGGYQEGWALYVEFLSFAYAQDLLSEAGYPELAPAVAFERHSRSLLLCLYSLLDIMIHYENASYETIKEVLELCGITGETSINTVYTYLVEEPANYLKYYLGYLEILSLQNEAKTLWGDQYSDYAFHTFFLECGPSDFVTIEIELAKSDVQKYISVKKAGLSEITLHN